MDQPEYPSARADGPRALQVSASMDAEQYGGSDEQHVESGKEVDLLASSTPISRRRSSAHFDLGASFDDKWDDIAEEVLQRKQVAITEADNARVRRKLDMILMPMFTLLYTFQFLDKVCYGYSSVWGLRPDLHLNNTQYLWGGSIFYVGFLLAQATLGKLAQRLPIAKLTSATIVIWSGILMCIAAVRNPTGLLFARFFLGFAEAFSCPTVMIMTGMWYTRQEQPLRQMIWFLGAAYANIIGGLVGYGIGRISHPEVAKWKIFYLLFGGATIPVALLFYLLVPDSPSNARWLNQDEKVIALERIRSNMTGFKSTRWKWPQFWETLKDPQVVMIACIIMFNCFISSGITNFGSIIVRSFGLSPLDTTLLTALPASLLQLLMLVPGGILASTLPAARLWVCFFAQFPSIVGAAMLVKLPLKDKVPSVIGQALLWFGTSIFSIMFSVLSANTAGFTKKTTSAAIVFGAFAFGQIFGPLFFIRIGKNGKYNLALGMTLVCLCVNTILLLSLRIYYTWENKRRDRLLLAGTEGHPELRDIAAASETYQFKDQTDRQNVLYFRYVM